MKKALDKKLILATCISTLVSSTFAMASSPTKKIDAEHIVVNVSYKPHRRTVQSERGRTEYKAHNCSMCHSIGGKGGCLGPPLDAIGKRRNSTFLTLRISNHRGDVNAFQRIYGAELMPHPRLAPLSAKAVVAYLQTIPGPSAGFIIEKHSSKTVAKSGQTSEQGQKVSLAEGKQLYNDAGCQACHSINGLGGTFGPDLSDIGERMPSQAIEEKISRANFLINGKDEYNGRGAAMPPLNLTEKDVRAVTEFLKSLKSAK